MAVFGGADPEGDEATAWRAARETFERFDSADYYLFTVPMWNARVPYILKQFIDVVSQPGMVFGFDPVTGYTGFGRASGSRSSTRVRSGAPFSALTSARLPAVLLRGLADLGGHRRDPQHRVPPQPGHRRPGARTRRRARPSHRARTTIPLPRQTSPAGRVTGLAGARTGNGAEEAGGGSGAGTLWLTHVQVSGASYPPPVHEDRGHGVEVADEGRRPLPPA